MTIYPFRYLLLTHIVIFVEECYEEDVEIAQEAKMLPITEGKSARYP